MTSDHLNLSILSKQSINQMKKGRNLIEVCLCIASEVCISLQLETTMCHFQLKISTRIEVWTLTRILIILLKGINHNEAEFQHNMKNRSAVVVSLLIEATHNHTENLKSISRLKTHLDLINRKILCSKRIRFKNSEGKLIIKIPISI